MAAASMKINPVFSVEESRAGLRAGGHLSGATADPAGTAHGPGTVGAAGSVGTAGTAGTAGNVAAAGTAAALASLPAGESKAQAAPAISREQAARFLMQAGFGGDAAAINDVIRRGYAGWIDGQLGRTVPGGDTHLGWLIDSGHAVPDSRGAPRHYNGLDATLWRRLITSPAVLRQRVALALSEIFVVSMLDGAGEHRYAWCGAALADYMDRLEAYAFGPPGQPVLANGPGTYRFLLEKVALSHAMGKYLSMHGSRKADLATGRQPDENFARELMQLLSIGLYELWPGGVQKTGANGQPVPTYADREVRELARVFTGWTWNGYSADHPAFIANDMRCDPRHHDTGIKSFVLNGRTVQIAGSDGLTELRLALDAVAAHPNVAPFICRQLIQRLVTSAPPPDYVRDISAVFNNNGSGVRGDLGAVVRAILLHPHARNPPGWNLYGRLSEPMCRVVQWARTFGAAPPDGNWGSAANLKLARRWNLADPVNGLAQSPLRAPSVFNFFRPGYVPPALPRNNGAITAPEFQLLNETTVVSYTRTLASILAGSLPASASYAGWLNSTPQQLCDEFAVWLTAARLGTQARARIVSAVTTMPVRNDEQKRQRVMAVIWLIMCSREYLVQR